MPAYSRILGSGFVTGEVTVPNERMEKVCDTTDEWIRERSGIQQRYYVREGTATSDLGSGGGEEGARGRQGQTPRTSTTSWSPP